MIGHGHSTVIKYLDNDDNREAFNLFDKDSSGYIDPKVLLTTLHPLVGDCCKLLEADHLYPTSSLMRRSVRYIALVQTEVKTTQKREGKQEV